jgi:hypothetical protein
VPIAFFGVGAYVAMIVLLQRTSTAHRARFAFVVLTGLGTFTSGGLLVYARLIIHATCWWCVASGIAMTLLFISSILFMWRRQSWLAIRPAIVWSLAVLTAIGVGLEAGLMQRAAVSPPISARHLAGLTVDELVDPAKSHGPVDAPVTIIEFADLACWACRMAHASLTQYQHANPAGVRLVFRHLPLWQIRGHELSRAEAALGEMIAEHGKFWDFLTGVYSRTRLDRAACLQLMQNLGFDSAVAEARAGDPGDPAIARVFRDEALAERLGINQTPTFILLVAGQHPISANPRTLPRLLNSLVVQSALARSQPLERNQDLRNR